MTTVLDQLVSIRSQLDAAITQLSNEQTWSVPTMTLAGEAGYVCEPNLVECANGDILCLYRRGTAHVSNGATLQLRRSTDRGRTWGAPVTLHAVANRDCRNQTIGRSPDTGRLIAFSRTTNGTTHDKHFLHISDDHGHTWTSQEFTPAVHGISFGRIVKTTRGLCRMSYVNNKVIADFSVDDGRTWGNPTYPWNASQIAATFTESFVVALDESRIVVVIRDDQDGGRYFWSKSADGGATWTFGPSPSAARWTSTTLAAAAPVSMVLRGGKVWTSWDGRSPRWTGYVTETDVEVFWQNPHHAWQAGIGIQARVTHKSVIASGGSATSSEYGYSNMLSITEGVLCAWYDSKTGSGQTECRALIQSL